MVKQHRIETLKEWQMATEDCNHVNLRWYAPKCEWWEASRQHGDHVQLDARGFCQVGRIQWNLKEHDHFTDFLVELPEPKDGIM